MGIYIYSFIVTLVLLFTNWIFLFKPFGPDNDRSSDFDRTERELQKSRETIDGIRERLTECRRIFNNNEQGVEGVIERLRRIAEEVKILEDIVNSSNTT